MCDMDTNIHRIAKVIQNYTNGQFGVLDCNHVKKWLSQFDNQEIVALETANLLENYYVTNSDFENFIDEIHSYLYNNLSLNDDVYILETQNSSKSQNYLNTLLFQKYGSNYGNNYPMGNFVYMDDFLFSGHTLQKGLSTFLDNMRKHISSSSIIYILCINYNCFNIDKMIEKLKDEYSINIKIIPFFDKFNIALNETLRPTQDTLKGRRSFPNVRNYTNDNLSQYRFSPRIRENNNYIQETNRRIYESEMINAGVKIINSCRDPHSVMKPLGYGWYGYGAGFTVFTQRNCPNTTPLAFWWGNPKADSHHPFSKWYPLMQRIQS